MSISTMPSRRFRTTAGLALLFTVLALWSAPSLGQAQQAADGPTDGASVAADASPGQADMADVAAAATPSLDCTSHGRGFSLEISPPPAVCHISGGPATDTSFTITIYYPPPLVGEMQLPRPDTLCTGMLADGGGTCTSRLVSSRFGLRTNAIMVSAALQPSGTVTERVPLTPALGPGPESPQPEP